MTHRAQNLIAALAIATFATGAFAQTNINVDFSGTNPSADGPSAHVRDGFDDGSGGNPDAWNVGTEWDATTPGATAPDRHIQFGTGPGQNGFTDSTLDSSNDGWTRTQPGLTFHPGGTDGGATLANTNYWSDDIITVETAFVPGKQVEGWNFAVQPTQAPTLGSPANGFLKASFNPLTDSGNGNFDLYTNGFDIGGTDPGTRPYKYYGNEQAGISIELDDNGNPFDRDGDGQPTPRRSIPTTKPKIGFPSRGPAALEHAAGRSSTKAPARKTSKSTT